MRVAPDMVAQFNRKRGDGYVADKSIRNKCVDNAFKFLEILSKRQGGKNSKIYNRLDKKTFFCPLPGKKSNI